MVTHTAHYSKLENPNANFTYNDLIGVDMFPYKVKGRDKFYHRNHPQNLNPDSYKFITYWEDFIKKCVEGLWIKDDNGVWVYMMPKLFYYVNYVRILDKDRRKIHPDLCDLEWIYFSYFMCLDGFSGFEEDDTYTCHRLVERVENSLDKRYTEKEREMFALSPIELTKIPDSCYSKETGKLKKFIDPWEFLTRTYLIDDPRGKLGQPLYENKRKNGLILGARAIRKSFSVFMGDFMHEYTFSGVRKYEDLEHVNDPLLFGMGCGSSVQLQRTLNNIKGFYDSQPGKYKFREPDIPDYMGPMYKNYQGKFEVGGEFQHIIKGKNNIIELFGSTVQMSVIRPDRTKIGAGDRFRRIYIEEIGFLEYIKEVYHANRDSLAIGDEPVGSWIGLGTGGDMESIKGPKEMFDNPDGFDIMGVPNYWRKNNKKVALFISCLYQKRKYEDENGFIFLDEAIREVDRERQKWMETLDSVSYTSRINYNPIIPDEMLVPNERSILPKKEAQHRLNEIKDSQLLKFLTNIGELVYDTSYPHGVRFDKDTKKKLKPILDYNVDFQKIDTSGAFVMYEPPPSGKIPKFMYWVVYDPAAQSGEGTSLHSVIVYKHFLSKDGKNMSDTIVAEWVGRKMTLDQNYDMVIRIAKYYNAKIFPETNIAGFVEWCKTNNHLSMLQRDSYELEQEISPGSKRSYYKAGFQMTGRKKWWAMQRFSDWLLEVRSFDPESGVPDKRNIDFIFSTRILDEVVYFNDVDNFDHLSSCFGLMLLLNQLDTQYPKDLDEDPEDDPWGPDPIQPIVLTRRRSLLESF